MSRSSIFSFESLRVRPSDLSPLPLLLAIVVLVVGELTAGWLIAGIQDGWNYWSRDAAARFIGYQRRVERDEPPRVLVAGDSTAAYGFAPAAFNRAAGEKTTSWNLGILGNFPLAFDATFNDIVLSTPGSQASYLFISFARGAFMDTPRNEFNERAILSSPVVRSWRGEFLVADYLAMARIWRLRIQIAYKLTGNLDAATLDYDLGLHRHPGKDRAKLEPPSEQQVLIVSPERLAVIERCFRAAQELGVRVVLLLPPLHPYDAQRWSNPDAYFAAVSPICEEYDVPLWDYTDDHGLEDEMVDLVHLNAEGAKEFSKRLGNRWRDSFLDNDESPL